MLFISLNDYLHITILYNTPFPLLLQMVKFLLWNANADKCVLFAVNLDSSVSVIIGL